MKITISNLDSLLINPDVIITHGDEKIIFVVGSYNRDNFKKFDIFHQLNMYWGSLNELEQEKVFTTYKEIRNIFDTIWDKAELDRQLKNKIHELLANFDFQVLLDWMCLRSDVIIPSDFKIEYVHSNDNHNTRDQTYIRHDYIQLVTLSLIMRSLIPVWGEYISRTRQDIGTMSKEFYAFRLLLDSPLLSMPVFDKIRLYIDVTVGKERDSHNTVINGINSEDFPNWMLGLVCIRRLCIGDIRGTEPRVNLVTFIHKFITQKVNGSESNGANIIKPKLFDDSGDGGDSGAKLSALERYKIKMPISIGEVCELEHSVKDVASIAFRLCPLITGDVLLNAMTTSNRLMGYNILEPQMTLLRWVFKPIISPVGIKYLSKRDIVNCLGVCQAVLWLRGHKYLAMLVTAYAEPNQSNIFMPNIDTRARIPKELADVINELYPNNKRISNRKTQSKPINLAMNAIDRLVNDLEVVVWSMSADMELIIDTFGTGQNRRIAINHDIRVTLAKLVIEIGSRNWI